MNTPQIIAALGGATLLYYIGQSIYRVYIHPLSKFPGPKHAAISDVWFAYAWLCGKWPQKMLAVHQKYGDVVRIAPNELSFATPQAYNDVYGHAGKGRSPFLKDDFYDMDEDFKNLVSARDPVQHQEMRRMLSTAFSARSLRAQEDQVVHKYTDLFMQQIGKLGAPGGPGVNMEQALTWATFDVIGDLAFGEPFGATEAGKTDFWISILLDGQTVKSLAWLRRRLPILNLAMPLVLPKNALQNAAMHERLTHEKAMKRLATSEENTKDGDFFATILGKRGKVITEPELISHAATFIAAGSETTSTTLYGILVYLMTKPDVFAKLAHEVRGAFANYLDITGDSTARLPYVHGVAHEGLRLFPAVPQGLSRTSPGAEVDGHYVPAGTTVRVAHWNTHRDPRFWHDPLEFKPERWMQDCGDNRDAFNAFSRGPRVCIGINLAKLEMQIIIAKIAWLYDLEWVNRSDDYLENCKLRLLWWKPPLIMRLHPRAGLPEGFHIPSPEERKVYVSSEKSS